MGSPSRYNYFENLQAISLPNCEWICDCGVLYVSSDACCRPSVTWQSVLWVPGHLELFFRYMDINYATICIDAIFLMINFLNLYFSIRQNAWKLERLWP